VATHSTLWLHSQRRGNILGAFTCYRPQIIFKILDYQISMREWASETSWSLSLEEE